MEKGPDNEGLRFGEHGFNSRLIMGSAGYPNHELMEKALEASGAELVTVAIRRADPRHEGGEGTYEVLRKGGYKVLPNTAGCYTARDAVFTAELAREALGTDLIKLEVIGDDETLFPDVPELLKAAEELVGKGFTVLPYSNDDPITARKLEDIGCAAVMPLGAPIGSGMGIRNPYNLRIIRERSSIPLIVDAGVGTASDAAYAMELGMDGVLLNSAVSKAKDPVLMASSMEKAVRAGREAFEAGRIPKRLYAEASSPEEGVPGSS